MPMILREESIAATSVNQNLWAGSAFEFARQRAIASFALAQSATGMFATLQAGADIVAEEFSMPIKTVYPVIPDDFYFTDVVEVGDRLVARIRNPTAGAIYARGVVQLSAG